MIMTNQVEAQLCQSTLEGDTSAVLIDVRSPAEFRALHVPNSRNVPLYRLDPKAAVREMELRPETPIYLLCRTGARSKRACKEFLRAGVDNVHVIEGGVQSWLAAGCPVEWGKPAMTLERQVRIAAGSLIVLGIVLALVHPAFLAISGFVGCGLIFSGITDTCGMGMMLARMPWNQ